MKKLVSKSLCIFMLIVSLPSLHAQSLGITFGFNKAARDGSGGTYNKMLFKPGTDADWWDAMVEEVAYSGIDYIAPVCRGYSPNYPNTDAGDPRILPDLVAAMDRRGLGDAFKIAIFDDCPASWTANRNLDKGDGYDYTPKFDCADTTNYKYIWDLNLKLCIQNIPDEKRFKVNNRLVLFFWTITDAFAVNQNGNLKKILLYIRSQCQATFGFNPYIVVDKRFFYDDPSTNDPAVVDAAHNWFSAPFNSYSLQLFNKVRKVGCVAPGFSSAGTNVFMDPAHGQRLIDGLEGTVRKGAFLTLGEGFTDVEEEAAYWRSKDTVYYDYPNQRLNITRRYTKKAYADTLKVEAEGCDFYYDTSNGNAGGAYREGNMDIVKTTDTNGGWMVTYTRPTEWLEWKELPLLANTKFLLRYSATAASSIQFSVDGMNLTAIDLPSTKGEFSTVDAGRIDFPTNSLHTVRLNIISGSPKINYFTVQSATITGVESDKLQRAGFAIYPNPASSVATISYQSMASGSVRIELYNAQGTCLQTIRRNAFAEQSQIEVNVSDIEPGIYFIKYTSDDFVQTKQLLVK